MTSRRIRVLTVLACTAAPIAATPQQAPKAPRVQPPELHVGTLRERAHVEADFLVYWNTKTDAAIEIEAPAFVEVLRKQNDADRHGSRTRVWLRIDTQRAGALQDEIRVTRGKLRATVPVRAVVLPRDRIAPRVLVAETPYSGFATSDDSLYTGWRRVVDTGKLEVHYLSAPVGEPIFSAEQLQHVDTVLLGNAALVRLTDTDRALMQGFVCGGGRLVVAASRFMAGSVESANRVIRPFGLTMLDAEGAGGLPFEAKGEDLDEHELTEGVDVVKTRRPTPTRIDGEARALVRVPGSDEFAFVAMTTTPTGGEVVTLGVQINWLWAQQGPGNVRLLRNLLSKPRRPIPPR